MSTDVNMSTAVNMGTDVGVSIDVNVGTDAIRSRYRVTGVVARSEEATTWDAHDTWLEQPVLLVTPEPGTSARFEDLTASLREHASPHLVGLYDAGPAPAEFAVLQPPDVTMSNEWSPRDEEDVLVAGQSLGDAVTALHQRGIVHGGIHPGTVVLGDGGDVALSPWPLAPEPPGWSGPGGFASDPHEPHGASAAGDVRALGALLLGALAGPPLLGALAGPPLLSSEQVEDFERELSARAPGAVVVAHRALRSTRRDGYRAATELRDDCAATLAGEPLVGERLIREPLLEEHLPTEPDPGATEPDPGATETDQATDDPPEGRRMAVAVAVAVALVAGASATGALSGPPPRPDAAGPKACAAHRQCGAASTGSSRGTVRAPATGTPPPAGAPARGASTATFADVSVAGSDPAATTPPAAPVTRPAVATSTSTTAPASTTSTSSTSSTTSTSTTSTVPPSTTTTTTTPPSTTSTTSSPAAGTATAGPTAGEPSGPIGGE